MARRKRTEAQRLRATLESVAEQLGYIAFECPQCGNVENCRDWDITAEIARALKPRRKPRRQ